MLTLPIKKKWFDMICSGEKREEYRGITDYYDTRFRNVWGYAAYWREPHEIRFRNGYSKNSPSIIATCTLSVMSVYVMGMKTPSCCMFCPVSNNYGCGLANPPIIMTSKEMLSDRPEWYHLVPVPPHGRLIDADALAQAVNDFPYGYRGMILAEVAIAPTIIPESKEN